MPAILFLLGLFLYIYCEISLLVFVGSSIGILPLILLMITISMVGLWLLKLRGVITLLRIREQLAQGQVPTQAVVSSLFFAIAGILFLIPGFLSDMLAILLLLPFTQQLLQASVLRWFSTKVKFTAFGQKSPHNDGSATTFEAEFERQQDQDRWIK